MKILLTLLATGAWFWFSHYWYTCELEQVCYGCGATASAMVAPAEAALPAVPLRSPLDFSANSETAFTNDGFEAYKAGILAGDKASNSLEITGYYDVNEENTSTYNTLGLARAAAAARVIAPDLPESRLILKDEIRDMSANPAAYFEAVSFNWTAPGASSVEVKSVDEATIRFPFNDANDPIDPGLDTYLNQVVARVKASGERVQLIGHTDNVGSETYNMQLGQARASHIKAILMSKGLDSKQVLTNSKGEGYPEATNATAEGQQRNRRVELSFLPKKS